MFNPRAHSHAVRADPVGGVRDGAAAWFRLTLLGVLALSAIRVAVLFSSPLELYPDEAQYWLWAQRLAFGYYSKPPMVAWLIAATTAIGGDAEAWVRLSAPLVHGLAALAQFRAAERLFGPRQGAVAALLYSLMPGVMLSSSAIATDAPLFLFGSCALWAYAELWRAESEGARRRAAAWLGVALGLAFLSKYAAAYVAVGLALHAASSRRARALWGRPELALTAGISLALLAPNLVWNGRHQFSTITHTLENATAERRAGWLNLRGALGFLVGQAAVFGPIPLLLLAVGSVRRGMARSLDEEERLLLCWVAPPLAIVLAEAVLARANANWAAMAYVAACPLVAAWLVRWAARKTTAAIVVSQGLAACVFLTAILSPPVADGLGLGSGLKRARGRAEEARVLARELASAKATGPVTAIAVDQRFEFNTLAYYGRRLFADPGTPPLRMWIRGDRPHNQAELEAPLRRGPEGARVLFIDYVDHFTPQARADFSALEWEHGLSVPLDGKHRRQFTAFIGRDFRPRPRDAFSDLPRRP